MMKHKSQMQKLEGTGIMSVSSSPYKASLIKRSITKVAFDSKRGGW